MSSVRRIKFAHLLRFDEETVVAVVGFDHVQSVAAGQQVGQLCCRRSGYSRSVVMPPTTAGTGHEPRAAAHTAAVAADVVIGQRLGQGDVGPRIEARDQFGALMFQVARCRTRHRSTDLRRLGRHWRIARPVPAHRGKSGDESARQLHARIGRPAGAVMVAAEAVGVGLITAICEALGPDLVGGGTRPDRQHRGGANARDTRRSTRARAPPWNLR